MEYVLQTKSLCKNYGNFKALDGVTINVPKGAVYGLVGRNGAGKTTLMRVICGLQPVTSGEFSIYGIKNTDKKIYQARMRMGALLGSAAVIPEMTAFENLKHQYRIAGAPSFESIPELMKLTGLDIDNKKKVRNFSAGMRQRLGIAVALVGNPDLLVLDEPVNSIDPQGIIDIRELILKLNREKNITVIIASHILDELSRIAGYYGFIDGGKIIREVSREDIEASFRKHLCLKVSDVKSFAVSLDKIGCKYSIESDDTANIYDETNITKIVTALSAGGCEVYRLTEHIESLESYFINLPGAENDKTY